MKQTARKTGFLRMLGAVMLLVGPLCAQQTDAQRLGTVLLQGRGPDSAPGTLEQDVAALGTPVIPAIIDALARGRFADPQSRDEGDGHALRVDEDFALLDALALLPIGSVRGHVSSLAEGSDQNVHEACVRVVGKVGLGQDLPLLAEMSQRVDGGAPTRQDRAAFEQALARILERDPEGIGYAERAFDSLHDGLIAPLIEAVAGVANNDAIHVLASRLGRQPAADPLLLVHVGRLGGRLHSPFHATVLEAVRKYLRTSNYELVLIAAHTVGQLEDTAAVPVLIELLDDPMPAIPPKAAEVLRSLTREQIGVSPSRWSAWYAAEAEWWSQEARGQLDEFKYGEAGEVSELLMKVSRHRLYRHEIAEAVSEMLNRNESELVFLACSTLGYLESWTAVPALVAVIEDPDEQVRTSAARALHLITGLPPGATTADWRALED